MKSNFLSRLACLFCTLFGLLCLSNSPTRAQTTISEATVNQICAHPAMAKLTHFADYGIKITTIVDTLYVFCDDKVVIYNVGPASDGVLQLTYITSTSFLSGTTFGDAVTVFNLQITGSSSPSSKFVTQSPDSSKGGSGLWATENTNNIAHIAPDGTFTEYPIPTPNSFPAAIVAGPDGNIWFVESVGNNIGRITPNGVITEFPVPTANALLGGITVGSDGNLYFTEVANNGKIGRITTSGVITELPNTVGGYGIVTGSDGNLWVAAAFSIIRTTLAGVQTTFPLPQPRFAAKIVNGPDGALWYVNTSSNSIGRITTAGVITETPFPTSNAVTLGVNAITVGSDGALYVAESNVNQIAQIFPVTGGPTLVSATLPASRSVQVGATATAFATILNPGPATAHGCFIVPITLFPDTFSYQTTDPASNGLIGTPNTPVDIAANVAQSFLIAFKANGAYVPNNVDLSYSCADANSASEIVGVNSMLLTFDPNPVPDVIAVGLTPSNDGFSHTNGTTGTGLFVIASDNIGASASLTASAQLSNSSLPITATVCQTDPSTSACLATPSASVTATINNGQTPTWAAFLTASGTVIADPANNRVFFQFVDSSGIVRGSTSTAVTTQ
jgi:streptogramin lyase